MAIVGIIIPTWNNPEYLIPCVQSIMRYTAPEGMFHVYIVNNGDPGLMKPFVTTPYVTILQQSENLGWEGGLKAGLAASTEEFVCFLNDDTHIPPHSALWLTRMLDHFAFPNCGAVGPSSNCVMGKQQIFADLPGGSFRTKFLIGFCMLMRRADLDAAGGVDAGLPGGDDLDLSIRLRKLGKYLICNRDVFVYHHGFKTGSRVRSDWNSAEMTEATNQALIRKHGLLAFLDLWQEEANPPWSAGDTEGDLVRSFVKGRTLELGCGDNKTVPGSVGVDVIPMGKQIPGLTIGRLSVADVQANVQTELPVEKESFDTVIARHVLEHMTDTVAAIKNWREVLKPGGRAIIAVPNDEIRNTIPLNFEHRHAFTPQSLNNLMETLGFKTVDLKDGENNISFVGCWEKN